MTIDEVLEDIKKQNIKVAMDHLSHATRIDPSYAHEWQCKIATAFYDSISSQYGLSYHFRMKVAHEGASRFMKQMFNVETSQGGPEEVEGK